MPRKVEPRKPKITAGQKMKLIHWKRFVLDGDSDKDRATLWWDLQEGDYEVEDFEAKFSQKQKKEKEGADEAKAAKSTKAKAEITKALDTQRSHAVGILISRLPPPTAIKTAILNLDEKVLEREQVKHCPVPVNHDVIAPSP